MPWSYDKQLYKHRNNIELYPLRLKRFRKFFTRYYKLDSIFISTISLAFIFDSLFMRTLPGRRRRRKTIYQWFCNGLKTFFEKTTDKQKTAKDVNVENILREVSDLDELLDSCNMELIFNNVSGSLVPFAIWVSRSFAAFLTSGSLLTVVYDTGLPFIS